MEFNLRESLTYRIEYLIILLTLVLLQLITSGKAQDCILATNGNRPLPNFIRPEGGGGAPQFRLSPIQAIITSYKFNCCGVVTEWRAIVHRSSTGYFQAQPYSMSFQVWRPNSPSPVDTDGCYTMIGVNNFSPILLGHSNGPDKGIVTGRPVESERIEFQPGDVIGFYLESRLSNDDSVQFAGDTDNTSPYLHDTVWFADNSKITEGPPTCPFPVGAFRTLDSSTFRAPLITATVSMSDCPVATAIQPSATRHISTPTPTPTPMRSTLPSTPSYEVPTPISPSMESHDPTSSPLLSSKSSAPTPTPSPQESSTTAHSSPPSQESHVPPITTDTPELIGGAGSIGLYVGTAVPVSVLVVSTVLVFLVIVCCVVKKKESGLGQDVANSTKQQRDFTEQDPYYSSIKELPIKENRVCGKFNAPAEYYNTTDLPSDIPATQDPAYGDIHTKIDGHSDIPVSEETDDGMILNEIYFSTERTGSGNDLSIPTTENEAYIERVDNEAIYDRIIHSY